MSSRERMLATLEMRRSDYLPLSFMIFTAMAKRCADPAKAIEQQVELGLDVFVDLSKFTPVPPTDHSDAPGVPVRFGQEVSSREWKEEHHGDRYPLLHKEYTTPEGKLSCVVSKTDDWPYGDHVPFLDDYLVPRCKSHIVSSAEDLKPLRHLLKPPTRGEIADCREGWRKAKDLAAKHDLLVTAGWGVGADALAWLCGLENAVLMAIDDPDLFGKLLRIISEWNRARMEILLDEGVDLFIRRAWYEGTDIWSPDIHRRFFLPLLKEEAKLAHEAGAKFGCIMTSGVMALTDILAESCIDVLIGIDPMQDRTMDMRQLKQKLGRKICLWGGVNGFITVERGNKDLIRKAVREAIDVLAPGGGFILSPVDNVRDPSGEVWENTLELIEAWKEMRIVEFTGSC